MASLGKARIAQVHSEARISEAKSKKDAGIEQAVANQEKLKARYENDSEIAKAKRDFQTKQANYDNEVFGCLI